MVRFVWTVTLAASVHVALLAGGPTSSRPAPPGGDDAGKKPTLVLRVTPNMAFSPARVVASADIRGGADDLEELYCVGVE